LKLHKLDASYWLPLQSLLARLLQRVLGWWRLLGYWRS